MHTQFSSIFQVFDHWRPAVVRICNLSALIAVLVWPSLTRAMDRAQVTQFARDYLEADDEEREELAESLGEYDGPIEPVLAELRERSYEPVEAGYHPAEHFSVPELLEKHPDDLLYFTVPDSYRTQQATGLIIFLHGGGNTSSRRAPRYFMDFANEDDNDDTYQLGDVFAATGMIAVGPSAPWDEESSYRWCLSESDDYLADVIGECESRFNIDPDRVVLVGHSMGGFGAYHHIQRQPDRFAAVVVNAGSWSLAYLPVIRGTPLCIVQGVRDARPGERWHYTDIEYARHAHRLLDRQHLDHTYLEHPGEHAVSYGRPYIAKYLQAARKLRRNAFYPHVTLASPVGFDREYCFEVEHNRWLTLDEAVDGNLEYDELVSNGADDFDDWRLTHRTRRLEGAAIDAVNRGDNSIVVTTQNVARFTIWLHPRMVDTSRPVRIIVDGRTRFAELVGPSLVTALESYLRRRDWGLIYPIRIELAQDD